MGAVLTPVAGRGGAAGARRLEQWRAVKQRLAADAPDVGAPQSRVSALLKAGPLAGLVKGEIMEEIRKVSFCPHCGNRAPQKLVHVQNCSGTGWLTDTGEEMDLTVIYFTASCDTCNHLLIYSSVDDFVDDQNFNTAELVFPKSGELPKSVPKAVANIYNEAIRIKSLAPNAFAVQIRRALESLCEDRGAKKKVLAQRLQELADRGEIPPTLAEATDVLRYLGNIGAHAAEESVMPWQVHTMDEFFRAVVEYVYVAPSKLKDFRDSLSKFKSKSSGATDSAS